MRVICNLFASWCNKQCIEIKYRTITNLRGKYSIHRLRFLKFYRNCAYTVYDPCIHMYTPILDSVFDTTNVLQPSF